MNYIYNEGQRYLMISFKDHIIKFDIDESDFRDGVLWHGFELTDGTHWNMEWRRDTSTEEVCIDVNVYGVEWIEGEGWQDIEGESYYLEPKFKKR